MRTSCLQPRQNVRTMATAEVDQPGEVELGESVMEPSPVKMDSKEAMEAMEVRVARQHTYVLEKLYHRRCSYLATST